MDEPDFEIYIVLNGIFIAMVSCATHELIREIILFFWKIFAFQHN